MPSLQDNSRQPRCPVCKSTATTRFIHIQGVPVFCNVLRDSRKNAITAECSDIDLVFCQTCAHVYNAAFDPSRMQYGPQYDNTLDYSPTFQKYIRDLAQRLVSTYRLQGRNIIEIGCGQGEFLRLLAEAGQNRCLGFDPSYNSEQDESGSSNAQISIIPDYYSEQYAQHRADFLVCRQVLEHIREPVPFLKMIHSAGTGGAEPVIFVEVPNAMYTLKELGIWDLIYEHYSYFTALSLSRLFVEAGLKPVNIEEAFGGQYLCIEGRPADQGRKQKYVSPNLSRAAVQNDVYAFADNYHHTISKWGKILTEMGQSGAKAAVWGAGSKGITFLNVLKDAPAIDFVVDINPHKQGLFVPGTGQQVISPDRLPEINPEAIIVMNPLYLEEIEKMIRELDIPKEKIIRLLSVDIQSQK